MSATKILVVGPVDGRITELVSKVSAIQAKHGPFSCLFILGDLFHEELGEQEQALLDGKISLPIKTYFFQGSHPLPLSAQSKLTPIDNKGIRQLASNLYFGTHKSGVFVTPEGLRVAFCGGKWDPERYAASGTAEDKDDDQSPYMSQRSVQGLLAHPAFALPSATTQQSETLSGGIKAVPKQGTLAAARAELAAKNASAATSSSSSSLLATRPAIDLLLTAYWPTGVTLFASPSGDAAGFPDPTARMWGCPPIAQLASAACPRYHFALPPSSNDPSSTIPVGVDSGTLEMGAFWERAPYLNDLSSLADPKQSRGKESLQSVTRFVSLARFGNQAKRRWFLALNLVPSADTQATSLPQLKLSNLTQSPYFSNAPPSGSAKRTSQQSDAIGTEPNFRFEQRNHNKKARIDSAAADAEVPPPGYVCRICNIEGHYIRSCPSKGAISSGDNDGNGSEPRTMSLPAGLPSKPSHSAQHQHRQAIIPVGPDNCWFCLSNPNIAKHLVVSIGSESYLVFPKGGFVHPSVNNVPGGGHVLLVPLAHLNTLLPLQHDEADEASAEQFEEQEKEKHRIRTEFEAWKTGLADMYRAFPTDDNEDGHHVLEWTISRPDMSRMTHHQTQLLPIKAALVDQIATAVTQNLRQLETQQTGSARWTLVTDRTAINAFFDATSAGTTPKGYFYTKLGSDHEWLVPLDGKHFRFPVQFIRSTLAESLALPELEDWKGCAKPLDAETQDVLTFRSHFSRFNKTAT